MASFGISHQTNKKKLTGIFNRYTLRRLILRCQQEDLKFN